MGAIWLLLSDTGNSDVLVDGGGIDLLADLLRLRAPEYANCIHMAIGSLFFMCQVRVPALLRVQAGWCWCRGVRGGGGCR